MSISRQEKFHSCTSITTFKIPITSNSCHEMITIFPMTPFPAYKVVYDNNRRKKKAQMLNKIYNKIHDNSKRVIRFTNSK